MLHVDLAPTILDISGVNLSSVNVDGQSFLSQMVRSLFKDFKGVFFFLNVECCLY